MNENRVYIIGHTLQRNLCMSKKINEELSIFGERLAKLRKAAWLRSNRWRMRST